MTRRRGINDNVVATRHDAAEGGRAIRECGDGSHVDRLAGSGFEPDRCPRDDFPSHGRCNLHDHRVVNRPQCQIEDLYLNSVGGGELGTYRPWRFV